MKEQNLKLVPIDGQWWGSAVQPRILNRGIPVGPNADDIPEILPLRHPDTGRHIAVKIQFASEFERGCVLIPDFIKIIECRVWQRGRPFAEGEIIRGKLKGLFLAFIIQALKCHHFLDENGRYYTKENIRLARRMQALRHRLPDLKLVHARRKALKPANCNGINH